MRGSLIRGALPRVRWGAVSAGTLFALGAQITLGLIGLGLGFAASPLGSWGLGAGAAIWGLATPFVATFVGAYVATRVAGAIHPGAAQLHGVLVWCIGLIAGALYLSSAIAAGAQLALPAAPAPTATAAASGFAGLAAVLGLLGGALGAVSGRKSLYGDDVRRAYEAPTTGMPAREAHLEASRGRGAEPSPEPPHEPLRH